VLVPEVLVAVAVILMVFAVGSAVRTMLLFRRRVRQVLTAREEPFVQQMLLALRLAGGGSPRIGVLRWRLGRAVDAARGAVRDAVRAHAPVGDLPALLDRLESLARAHDATLAALGRGRPDPAQLRAATERVRDLVTMADQVRAGAVESLSVLPGEDPQALAGDIGTEVTALREGRRAAQA
jgi:hypothetical protein